MPKFKDLSGQQFDRLTVVKRVYVQVVGETFWECVCECGRLTVVVADKLNSKHTRSCGCLLQEARRSANTTHGKSRLENGKRPRIYSIWKAIKTRCLNANIPQYHDYGGRGIKICDRWLSFENFYEDMGEPPTDKHSIDRIDNNGNYEPGNCRWATPKEQSTNKRQAKKQDVSQRERDNKGRFL